MMGRIFPFGRTKVAGLQGEEFLGEARRKALVLPEGSPRRTQILDLAQRYDDAISTGESGMRGIGAMGLAEDARKALQALLDSNA